MNNPKQLELNFDKELPVSRAELLKAIKVITEAKSQYDWSNDDGCAEGIKFAQIDLEEAKENLDNLLDVLYDTPRNNV